MKRDGRHRHSVLVLAAIGCWLFGSPGGALGAEVWSPNEVEDAARGLANVLRYIEARPARVDAPREGSAPDVAVRTRRELQLAADEIDELVRMLREGRNREETYGIFQRIQGRRRALISLGRSTASPVVSKRDMDLALTIWNALVSHYETEAR